MTRLALSLILALVTGPTLADLRGPQRLLQPVADPSMVVVDRGSKLEVFPTKRAVAVTDGTGRMVVNHVVPASAESPIGSQQLGVVFNHAMQQQGYISGEITFQMKHGRTVTGLEPALYPGLKKITSPEVYAVNARTPAQFIKLLKRLQARSDLEWVEPSVNYGPADTQPNIR
jgi:hypothetical protein